MHLKPLGAKREIGDDRETKLLHESQRALLTLAVISDNLSRAGQLIVSGCVYKAGAYVEFDESPEKLGMSTIVSLSPHVTYLVERWADHTLDSDGIAFAQLTQSVSVRLAVIHH